MSQPTNFTQKQRGVVRGVILSVFTITATYLTTRYFAPLPPPASSLEERLRILALSLLFPALTLFVCIGRLGNHRFYTPQDIDSGVSTMKGSNKAAMLQAILQNTLEQLMLACIVYFHATLFLSPEAVRLVPATGALFTLGRIMFLRGYAGGAESRAFGFSLTFQSTLGLGIEHIKKETEALIKNPQVVRTKNHFTSGKNNTPLGLTIATKQQGKKQRNSKQRVISGTIGKEKSIIVDEEVFTLR
eukprot:CCRYP_015413-RC/>CCRYP_015413-RC protein AED:0.18 eAED:0.18 QI:0/0.8/0.66/1/0/0/6/1601/244